MFESRKLVVVLLSAVAWFPSSVRATALEAPKLRVQMGVQPSPTTPPEQHLRLAELVEAGLQPVKRCFGSALARNVETGGALRLRIEFDDVGRSTVSVMQATVEPELQRCVMQAVASTELKTPPTKTYGFLSVDFVNSVGKPDHDVELVRSEVTSSGSLKALGEIDPPPVLRTFARDSTPRGRPVRHTAKPSDLDGLDDLSL